MPADMLAPDLSRLDTLVTRGGSGRVALLRYCVMSVTLEPLFLFLAQEYRLRPAHAGAIALYDMFCAPGAPAPISAPGALPPQDLRLATALSAARAQLAKLAPAAPDDADKPTSSISSPRHLFDGVATAIRGDADGACARIAAHYNPDISPVANLPGGRMNAGQRQFVESVWKPRVRRGLVGAGFWQIATIE